MPQDLKITYRKTSELVPYARNARTHSDEQIAQVMASIKEFGFTNPILVDGENIIFAGHGRLIAAQRLGLDQVPTITLSDMTEAQRRAYVLADNKLALNAGWDDELLLLELGELKDSDFDLSKTGFSKDEIASIFLVTEDGETNPDEEWEGMPEFNQEDKTAFRTIPVHFKSDSEVAAFAKLVGQNITDKTRYLWYPEIEIETYADKQYIQDA